jgi:uncharacterized protein (TIGR01777 family)
MVIGITGATGFVGRHLMEHAHRRGHEIVAFSRSPRKSVERAVETRVFSTEEVPDLSGCEAVIHLAGEPILGFWTRAKRRAILESRVQGTRRIVEAIEQAKERPEVLLCSSAIGFYGDGGERELREDAPEGGGFLAEVCAAWEHEAQQAKAERVVMMRTATVLGRESGALRVMKPIFRLGLGGTAGDGRQWMSWIHVEDLVRLALFAVEDMEVRGPINASAPWPVRHAEFVKILAHLLHRPAFFRVPAFAVRLVLRGLSAELLESKRVVPAAATGYGFGFHFSELRPALRDLL